MLERNATYDEVCDNFSWDLPDYFNIGYDVCDKWADMDPARLALIDVDEDNVGREFTFGELKSATNRLANALENLDLAHNPEDGPDRIGVLLPQGVETAVSHIAALKMGCISIPLFTLFGEEALLHRLRDSGAKIVITNSEGCSKLSGIRGQLPDLRYIVSIDPDQESTLDYHAICAAQDDVFQVVETKADDPAILIYTSGTTGNPKGALHAHRVLPGHLPGVEISHNFLPQEGDRLWTPADWAWIGGLLDVLLPGLHHGVPVVARRFAKFDAEAAFDLIIKYKIRNAFLPPTALKLMKQVPDVPRFGMRLRSVASGGETLGQELLKWGQEAFGATINEFYGQTECNMLISACTDLEPPRGGYMGREVPGHTIRVIDPITGEERPPDTEGAIAAIQPDPVAFLRYWKNPTATEEKFVDGPAGRWLLTGDVGTRDTSGRFRFIGRDDDVISSAGYRIGPSEVEDCLLSHPAVRLAGVVGKPDDIRGAIVAAYIVLREGVSPSEDLKTEISAHVKLRLSAHEYPRSVTFIDDMPMTTTGKIIRRELRNLAQIEIEQDT